MKERVFNDPFSFYNIIECTSSLKKRDAAKQKAADDVNDDIGQTKDKLENSEEKSVEKDAENVQKKAFKKEPTDDNEIAVLENDGTVDEMDQDINNDDNAAGISYICSLIKL